MGLMILIHLISGVRALQQMFLDYIVFGYFDMFIKVHSLVFTNEIQIGIFSFLPLYIVFTIKSSGFIL